ncbi:MAG TPA: ferrochelatase [Nocardioidaceae bacterium]|nr:ferrochelatase [Nocardioidaceae bacterium]
MSDLEQTGPYDALLVVSFGGPENVDDVRPFLENVTRGRGVPPERLDEVAKHYLDVGGRSPINDQCREFIAAVRQDLDAHGVGLPVYWGNRNWHPFLGETVQQMAADGITRAAVFVTSAYASYSGCRQYRENLFDAVDGVERSPRLDKLRHYFNHPGFIEAFADSTCAALDLLPDESRDAARLVFVTHSIPTAMAETSGPSGGAYVDQHRSVADLVAGEVARRRGTPHPWELAFCSRSGPPHVPWLEPDVNDHLETLAGASTPSVVVVPIGFVSDHMEVVYDLDTEAAATADKLGIDFARAAAPGSHPAFVATVRDLLVERAAAEASGGDSVTRSALGDHGATWDSCLTMCCPNPRERRGALCEVAA